MTILSYCHILSIVMEATISVTSKWQIHIPKALRSALGPTRPGQVNIRAVDNKLVITPHKSKILSLAGKFHKYYLKNKHIDIDNIRDYIDYSKA